MSCGRRLRWGRVCKDDERRGVKRSTEAGGRDHVVLDDEEVVCKRPAT